MRTKENVHVGYERTVDGRRRGEVDHHKCTRDSLAHLQPTLVDINHTTTFRRCHTCVIVPLSFRARMA